MSRSTIELEAQLLALKRQGAAILSDREKAMDLVEELEGAIERAIGHITRLERENHQKDKQLIAAGVTRGRLLQHLRAAKARLKSLETV